MNKDLIAVLLDKNADEADRDDAAMWLRNSIDDETLNALYEIASDSTDNYFIRIKVGSVLGEIITKRNKFNNDKKYLLGLTKDSYEEAIGYIKSLRPNWVR